MAKFGRNQPVIVNNTKYKTPWLQWANLFLILGLYALHFLRT